MRQISYKMHGIRSGHLTLIDRGGAWVAADRLAKALDEHADAWCEVLQADSMSLVDRTGAKLDFELARLSHAPLTTSLFRSLGSGRRLRRVIEARGLPDIWNLHWLPGLLPPNLASQLRRPMVWTMHDMNPFTGTCHHAFDCRQFQTGCQHCPQAVVLLRPVVRRSIQARKSSFLTPPAVAAVAPSRWLAKLARSSDVMRDMDIRRIPNCAPVDVFNPVLREPARHVLGLRDRWVIGVLGDGYDATKNAAKAWEIATALAGDAGTALPVALVSFGHALTTSVSHVVEVTAGSPPSEVAQALAACDVLLYLSTADNLPNFLVEAQCAGVPVVALDVGGVSEAFVDGITGVAAETPDAAFLAARNLQRNPQLRDQFGIQARGFAVAEFAPSVVARAYHRLYEEVTERAAVACSN